MSLSRCLVSLLKVSPSLFIVFHLAVEGEGLELPLKLLVLRNIATLATIDGDHEMCYCITV